jgi:hypothetical protein
MKLNSIQPDDEVFILDFADEVIYIWRKDFDGNAKDSVNFTINKDEKLIIRKITIVPPSMDELKDLKLSLKYLLPLLVCKKTLVTFENLNYDSISLLETKKLYGLKIMKSQNILNLSFN